MRRLFLILVVAYTALPLMNADPVWQKIDNRSFSLKLPPLFTKVSEGGVDSFVQEFAHGSFRIFLDYGHFSDDFRDWPKEATFSEATIDGRPARIGVWKRQSPKGSEYLSGVYIKVRGPVALSMLAVCSSEQEVALARKIFLTIVFSEKKA